MGRALEAAGFAVLNVGYDSRRKSLDHLADDVRRHVAGFAAARAGPVHLVTHSMGGLVARAALARDRPDRLGRVVMLGPPNNGSEVADLFRNRSAYRRAFGPAGLQLATGQAASLAARFGPVDYEVGVVAGNRSVYALASLLVLPGPNDGRVTVRGTRLEGMADHVVVPAAHPWLMRDRGAIGQTIAFLRTGRFLHGPTGARAPDDARGPIGVATGSRPFPPWRGGARGRGPTP